MAVYDEVRRRSWSERANNGDPTLNIEAEAAEVCKNCMAEAEGIYDAIVVTCCSMLAIGSGPSVSFLGTHAEGGVEQGPVQGQRQGSFQGWRPFPQAVEQQIPEGSRPGPTAPRLQKQAELGLQAPELEMNGRRRVSGARFTFSGDSRFMLCLYLAGSRSLRRVL